MGGPSLGVRQDCIICGQHHGGGGDQALKGRFWSNINFRCHKASGKKNYMRRPIPKLQAVKSGTQIWVMAGPVLCVFTLLRKNGGSGQVKAKNKSVVLCNFSAFYTALTLNISKRSHNSITERTGTG
jgi:hypothetical protein